ncbi:MAG: T9SS type A sorting domain-containing protein [Bacteroidetes bacterium]|nr:T9SS type A sorting domain-containing protein [Bacteroidota bacterium]
MKKQVKKYSIIFTLIMCCFFSSNYLNAQPPYLYPATRKDSLLQPNIIYPQPGLYAITSLNSDMLSTGLPSDSNKLWAIAFGGGLNGQPLPPNMLSLAGIYLGCIDKTHGAYDSTVIPFPDFASSTCTIGQCPDIDVALANYLDHTGKMHYYVIGVYSGAYHSVTLGVLTAIYLEAYELNISSYPTIGLSSHIGPIVISDTTLGYPATTPRIDMCADNTGFSMPVPPATYPASYTPCMHKFAISWIEYYSPAHYQVVATAGDVTALPSITGIRTTITTDSWIGCDIACTHDPISNVDSAFITYGDAYSGAHLHVTGWSLNTYRVGATHTAVATNFSFPRIDAATIYDYNNRGANTLWHVVQAKTGAPDYIYHFGSGQYLAKSGPGVRRTDWEYRDSNGYDIDAAVICGTGNFFNGGESPGKDSFTVGFWSKIPTKITSSGKGDFYVYGVGNSFYSGATGPIAPGTMYQEVNCDPLNATLICSDPYVTVSNCSNTGQDILVAWFDGFDADCSYTIPPGPFPPPPGPPPTGNIKYMFGTEPAIPYAFKNAELNKLQNQLFAIAPNPATDYIKVSGIKKATYEVLSLSGQRVTSGVLTNDNNIVDVKSITPGAYIIQLFEGAYMQKIKFIKN